ncbi:DUF3662 domain-containing protein [Streptomyces sp. NPDC021212]|uniref:DUF3662 domain-containing protein n=1 Tax=Streptomyces sp. NPDC021212 TaxID=3365118 RepID=UPI003797C95D
MDTLTRIERAIERFEDALLAKMFPTEPVELLGALREECDSQVVMCSPSRVVVPNAYDVELSDEVYEELSRHGKQAGQTLADSLMRHAEERGYEWAGPLTVHVTKSSDVPNGRYRVVATPLTHIRADAFADGAR